MKRIIVIAGGLGSGKTELSLNLAFNYVKKQRVTLVDLDIVNPLFRTTERKAEIEAAGIRLLSPSFTEMGVEIPVLPADIYSAFSDSSDIVLFDVGGDDTGAVALGQYKRFFDEAEALEFIYVINARRPFASDSESNLDMLRQVQAIGRLKADALVNNTNLANETTVSDLIDGYDIVRSVSEASGIPVKYTVGTKQILTEFADEAEKRSLDKAYIGELMPIVRYMHRDWERFTSEGL